MAARQSFYAESLGESTSVLITPTTKVGVTFTPDASSTYWVIASADYNSNSATGDHFAYIELLISGSTTLMEQRGRAKEVTTPLDYYPFFAIAQLVVGASPASTTINLTFENSDLGDTAAIRNAHILVLKADASDKFAESTAEVNTTSSTYQVKTTLTFTPGSSGDYLIIGNAYRAMDVDATAGRTQLNHTTASAVYGTRLFYAVDDFDWLNWAIMTKVSLTAISNTFRVEYKSEDGATITYIAYARVLALRLDAFDNSYFTTAATPADGANSSYSDELALTQTPLNLVHARIAVGAWNVSSTTVSGYLQFYDGSTSFNEGIREGVNTAGYWSSGSVSQATLANASTTWSWQSKYESSITLNVADLSIAVLQLDATPAASTHNPNQLMHNYMRARMH